MVEPFNWTEFIANEGSGSLPIVDPILVTSVRKYEWMVIVGLILAFLMAWGIGANDVANAFATSVGAGSITLPMAVAIAAVMEFGGALLLGGQVTDTVRKKVINTTLFDPNNVEGAENGPELLMTGFFVSLISATIWLILATWLSLPVSTTHSIIGSLIGIGLAYRGARAVVWISDGSGFDRLKGVVGVILSWIISPVLSGIIAVLFFLLVRTLVLRRQDSFRNGLIFMPLFYGVTLTVAIFFIIYKGDGRFDLSDKLGVGGSLGVAFGAGVVLAAASAIILVPLAKKAVERWEERELEKAKSPTGETNSTDKALGPMSFLKKIGVNLTIEEDLSDDVIQMHENVEKFDPKTERLFTWVQVFTAAVDAFAHGANDVANAIAPFASIFQLHKLGGVLTVPDFDREVTYTKAGTYQGGQLNGEEYSEGDPIPDYNIFCGVDSDGNPFSACELAFPYRSPSGQTAKLFSRYDENGVYQDEEVECYSECNPRNYVQYKDAKQNVPIWILAVGGAGIVLGLAMWGYRIILAIGVKLTKLTPSRGFSIEIGAAITVLIASQIGLPVSTTHCQVGATMGVGLIEGKASTVNWKQFLMICVGWVFTVIFTGFLSAIIFLVVTYSPSNIRTPQGTITELESTSNLDFCPGNRMFVYNSARNGFSGVLCSGQDPATVPEETTFIPSDA